MVCDLRPGAKTFDGFFVEIRHRTDEEIELEMDGIHLVPEFTIILLLEEASPEILIAIVGRLVPQSDRNFYVFVDKNVGVGYVFNFSVQLQNM